MESTSPTSTPTQEKSNKSKKSEEKRERAEREGTRTVTQDTPKEENDLHEVKAQAIAHYYKVLSLHISRRQGITLGFHPEKTGNQIKSPSMG